MVDQQIQEKGILAKLLENGIKILLKKECSHIGKLKINIYASSIQIIKGIIEKIHIISEEINYKDLLFDHIELEANKVKLNLKISNKELKFENDPRIKFKISLSESSIKKILLSRKWEWIGNIISKEIFNQDPIENIQIKNGQLLIKSSTKEKAINEVEIFDVESENGKIYLRSNSYNKSINIPIEDKIYVENLTIQNKLITVFASSSISF